MAHFIDCLLVGRCNLDWSKIVWIYTNCDQIMWLMFIWITPLALYGVGNVYPSPLVAYCIIWMFSKITIVNTQNNEKEVLIYHTIFWAEKHILAFAFNCITPLFSVCCRIMCCLELERQQLYSRYLTGSYLRYKWLIRITLYRVVGSSVYLNDTLQVDLGVQKT